MNPDAIAAIIQSTLPTLGQYDAVALAQMLATLLSNPSASSTGVEYADLANALRPLIGKTLVIDGQQLRFDATLAVLGNVGTVQRVTIEAGGIVQGDIVGTQITIALPVAHPTLHQLRAPVADFVGRDQEIAQIVAALCRPEGQRAASISSIRGLGGVGKTELAFAVAQELALHYPDAQIVLSLRGSSASSMTPEEALAQVIAAFEPATVTLPNLDRLQSTYRARLAGKRALILADDARDAAQIRALLPPSGSALLITSRNRFELPGLVALDLSTLAVDQAETLILQICPRIETYAPELAILCGGLPLALRISASQIQSSPMLAPVRYLDNLRSERLHHLVDPDLHPDNPQASVAASLRLSYQALPATAQAALAQLSVFRASFDAIAAQAIVADADSGEESVALLHRRSLIEWDPAAGRITLHELVREFAAAQLHDSAGVCARHARHYGTVLQEVNRHYREGGPAALGGLELFDRERVHIEQGWSWIIQQMQAAPAKSIDQMFLDYRFASRSMYPLRYPPSARLVALELQSGRRVGNRYAESIALSNLADWHCGREEWAQAIALYEESLAVARSVRYRLGESIVIGRLSLLYKDQGDYARAVTCLQDALGISREKPHDLRNQRSMVAQILELGGVYQAMGDTIRAITCFNQALSLARSIGHLYGVGRALNALGGIYAQEAQPNQAITYYAQMLAVVQDLKDWDQIVTALTSMADIYEALGDQARSYTYYQQALNSAQDSGSEHLIAITSRDFGLSYERGGELERALPLLEKWGAILQRSEHPDRKPAEAYLEQLRARLRA